MMFQETLTVDVIVEQLSYEEWTSLRQEVEQRYQEESGYPIVVSFLRDGQLISAIKAYREITHEGLLESKNAVLEIAHAFGMKPYQQ